MSDKTIMSRKQIELVREAAAYGSTCEVFVPSKVYEQHLHLADVEIDEQFATVDDLSNDALMLLVQYFPQHAARFKRT